jgi:Fuc2NAc and GlcNAc transferase
MDRLANLSMDHASRFLVLLAAVAVSAALTHAVIRSAAKQGLMDMPADRKLHSVPTPRGGGLGFVVVTLIGTLLGAMAGWLPMPVAASLGVGGFAVALVGWLDDRKGLSAHVRLTIHALAAAWAVFFLGDLAILRFGSSSAVAAWASTIATVVLVTWAISAYNFMDGIDGLAGTEAVFVGSVGGLIAAVSGHRDVAFLSLLIAVATLGFLPWNMPPAKVFMGDVGSGFLGYSFAVVALFSEHQGALPVVGWLILLGVFAFDSTITLCRRIVRREAVFSTHRSSAYQRVAFRLRRHAPVTAAVTIVNFVLAAFCLIGWIRPATWPVLVAGALALLILLYMAVERYSPMERR